jgi:hypothetical protein
MQSGEIYIADSKNNRIQVFNQCGVYKTKYGEKGNQEGQFKEPCGVTVLEDGDIAVADTGNNRVQILTKDHEDNLIYRRQISTKAPPYDVVSDYKGNIIVSTTKRTIEIYDYSGIMHSTFDLGQPKEKVNAMPIALNANGLLAVSNRAKRSIEYYTLKGTFMSSFLPTSSSEGLACDLAGMCFTAKNEVLVADSLNHVINQYDASGSLMGQVLCPTDDAGAVQSCALGPEGHLVVIETNSNGGHCLKIFRFYECECHRTKPASAPSGEKSSQQLNLTE